MNSRNVTIILTITAIIIGYWWYMLVWHSISNIGTEDLRIHFLDVGQGDAILVETPDQNQVLIDAGRGIKVLNELDATLPAHDREIEVAIMTHPDADHLGGFIPILRRYNVGVILQSFISPETDINKKVTDIVQREGVPTYTIDQPYTFSLDDVHFYILWPMNDEITETNTASIVLLITYGKNDILLTGDAPSKIEDLLTTIFPEKLNDIEILKAGHHGSKTSTSQQFLSHTKPNAIIYSAGKNNTYGHPHDTVLDRVKTYTNQHPTQSITQHHTANGTVSFCITPTQFTLCD